MTPFLRRDDGSYIAIRVGDVERLYSDTRTRQMETERLRSQGIQGGYLYGIFRHTMLYAKAAGAQNPRPALNRPKQLMGPGRNVPVTRMDFILPLQQ